MKPAVLFDLGNTLVAYYRSTEFLPILEIAIAAVLSELAARNLAHMPFDAAFAAAQLENVEASDFRFTPITERFERIFEISLVADETLGTTLCRIFLNPIFAVGRLYADALPALRRLRAAGHPVAIVSNTPWGSPPELWREELELLSLTDAVDGIVLCGDVGWRKPAPAVFEAAAAQVGRRPDQCIFVGDDLQWDIAGSEAARMRAVLIDRNSAHRAFTGERVENLDELSAIVEA